MIPYEIFTTFIQDLARSCYVTELFDKISQTLNVLIRSWQIVRDQPRQLISSNFCYPKKSIYLIEKQEPLKRGFLSEGRKHLTSK